MTAGGTDDDTDGPGQGGGRPAEQGHSDSAGKRTPAQQELVDLAAGETLLVRFMRLDQDRFPITADPVPRLAESARRLVDILVHEAKYKMGAGMGALLDLEEDVIAYRFLEGQRADPN